MLTVFFHLFVFHRDALMGLCPFSYRFYQNHRDPSLLHKRTAPEAGRKLLIRDQQIQNFAKFKLEKQ